jgi:PAS domain S-box-containing protein
MNWEAPGSDALVTAVSIVPERDANGNIVGALAVGRDVTALTKAEHGLRESVRLYREVFDTVSESLIVIDVTSAGGMTIAGLNASAARFFSLSDETARGKLLDSVAPDYLLAVVNPHLKECLSSRLRQRSVHELNLPDARRLYVEFTIHPVCETDGTISRMILLSRDVTERTMAEDAIRKLNQAIEQSPAAIIITDPKGLIEYVNPKFTRVSGYSADEVIGKTPRFLQSGDKSSTEYRELWETIASGREWRGEFHNRKKDGTLFWESASISPMKDATGVITHYLAVKEDITEQKRLQDELVQSQRMQSLGTLAAGIAHDFNNILGIILGHANLIVEGSFEAERSRQSVRSIESAASRGSLLVRHLLTFAQKSDVTFESVRLDQALGDVVRIINEAFPRAISVTTHLPESLPPIYADAAQIHQVFLNLCVNARDAMPRGGSITISASIHDRAELVTAFPNACEDRYVCVTVADTGSGMDAETRRRIFEPFFTTKGPGKGTGLGLAIVFGVMVTHKGFIDVESEVGTGTAFHLYFPVQAGLRAIDPVVPHVDTNTLKGTETILIVEDEELLRDMLRMALTNKGYTVIEANNGVAAVEAYARDHASISLILTDMGLPRLEGAELVRALVAIDPSAVIIIASGYIEPDVKAEALRAGARDFLQKPYAQQDLLQKIRHLLDAGS